MRRALVLGLLACLWPAATVAAEPTPTIDLSFDSNLAPAGATPRFGFGTRVGVRPIRWLGAELAVIGAEDQEGRWDRPHVNQLRWQTGGDPTPFTRMAWATMASLVTSPLTGWLHSPTRAPHALDWYLLVGGGAVLTRDDTEVIRSPCTSLITVRERQADRSNGCHYIDQVHLALTWGTGLRFRLFGALLVGLEVRGITWEEEFFRDDAGQGEVGSRTESTLWWSLRVGASLPPVRPR